MAVHTDLQLGERCGGEGVAATQQAEAAGSEALGSSVASALFLSRSWAGLLAKRGDVAASRTVRWRAEGCEERGRKARRWFQRRCKGASPKQDSADARAYQSNRSLRSSPLRSFSPRCWLLPPSLSPVYPRLLPGAVASASTTLSIIQASFSCAQFPRIRADCHQSRSAHATVAVSLPPSPPRPSNAFDSAPTSCCRRTSRCHPLWSVSTFETVHQAWTARG